MSQSRWRSLLPSLLTLVLLFWLGFSITVLSAQRPQGLFLTYPPNNHQTGSDRIFLIGSAPPTGDVTVNGQAIARNAAGNFASSFPLQLGENRFTLQYGQQQINLLVTRLDPRSQIPTDLAFGKDSLTPTADVAHLPNEWVCFAAIAPPKAEVTVQLANQRINLAPEIAATKLPPNSAVLTAQEQPATAASGYYRGCTRFMQPGDLGQPEYRLAFNNKTLRQTAPGRVKILAAQDLTVAEVTAEAAIARTGPSSDYSRLTPLPKGVRAAITGYEGDWIRLDYGAWIRKSEATVRAATVPPTTTIRSARSRRNGNWTEIVFPLQMPVPISIQQASDRLMLTLHNTTAQTDTIRMDDDPLIQRLDWQQTQAGQIQYTFQMKSEQQWGYRVRYEGSSLVLGIRQPPQAVKGAKILLDPGHGGPEDLGARGPTGYPEKDVTLIVSKLVRDELVRQGITVVMTRETDMDVGLGDRVALIEKEQPTLALSLHYNALPDSGDAEKTQGVSSFWYHPQAQDFAVFLHNHLVRTLNRASYGVYWNNLALTRPTAAPSVLLEIGFMIHPDEFEWIVNPNEQKRLAREIAAAIVLWLEAKT